MTGAGIASAAVVCALPIAGSGDGMSYLSELCLVACLGVLVYVYMIVWMVL